MQAARPRSWLIRKRSQVRVLDRPSPEYVDGECTFNYQGVQYNGRKIEIPDPVPLDVFERNQRLLAITRGKQRVNPIGHYLLNRIPLTPARAATSSTNAVIRFSSAPLTGLTSTRDARSSNAGASRSHTPSSMHASKREWLESGIEAGHLDPVLRAEALAGIRTNIQACQRQLEYAQLKTQRDAEQALHADTGDDLLTRARRILTPTAPTDPDLAQRRAAFLPALPAAPR